MRVALTFDDGPNLATTPKILETLRRHNALATFFMTGSSLQNEDARALAREMAADRSSRSATTATPTWPARAAPQLLDAGGRKGLDSAYRA